jgi:cbb3-type cytochrome oxidase maturation protein
MSVIVILILASLAVGLAFVGAFVWSVRSGQYEDTLTPSMRVLADDAVAQVHFQKTGSVVAPLSDSAINVRAANKNTQNEIIA